MKEENIFDKLEADFGNWDNFDNFKTETLNNIKKKFETNKMDLFVAYFEMTQSRNAKLIEDPYFPEEMFKESNQEECKLINEEVAQMINKEGFKEFGLNKEKDSIEALIGDRGFFACKRTSIVNITPRLDQFLKKLLYKRACMGTAKSIERILELDLISLILVANSFREIRNVNAEIAKLNLTEKKVYEKIAEEFYVNYFLAMNDETLGMELEFTIDVDKELDKILKVFSETGYQEVVNVSSYKNTQVINRNLIKVDGIGEIELKDPLPDPSLNYKAYINTIIANCSLDKPFEYEVFIDLSFEEGQDKILNK